MRLTKTSLEIKHILLASDSLRPCFQQVLSAGCTVSGPPSQTTAMSVLRQQHQSPEALQVARKVVKRSRRINQPSMPKFVEQLGELLSLQGFHHKAERLLQERLKISRQAWRDMHLLTLNCKSNQSAAIMRQGELEHAEQVIPMMMMMMMLQERCAECMHKAPIQTGMLSKLSWRTS